MLALSLMKFPRGPTAVVHLDLLTRNLIDYKHHLKGLTSIYDGSTLENQWVLD